MSSRARPLPNIPVKHTAVRKVVNFTPPLEAKLRAYIAYYTSQQGLDQKQAPSESDTIVAIVEDFLHRDGGFSRYLRSEAGQRINVAVDGRSATDSTK